MTKETVLLYLNGRINKHWNKFDNVDVTFFQAFIQYRTGTLVDKQKIADSIVSFPYSLELWFDAMLTFLVNHFELTVHTPNSENDKIDFFQGAVMSSFMGRDGQKIIKYT